MSSAGSYDRPSSRSFWCHECNYIVSIMPSVSSPELLCPDCHGEFVEEIDSPPPPFSHNDNRFLFSFNDDPFSFGTTRGLSSPFPAGLAGLPFLLSPSSSHDLSGDSSPRSSTPSGQHDSDVFNPFLFLQNYLQNLIAGGTNIQFVLENQSGDGEAVRLPASLGDYFIGPGLEQLIQQLAENDPNRYGTPPASKPAVESLPEMTITETLMGTDAAQCAVCKDEFKLGSSAKQMPCKHIYHTDCILPWLELHNSCPVCRYELPTDDPDYERQRVSRETGQAPAGGSTGIGSQTDPPNRRFRISLPLSWPMMGSGEASNDSEGRNRNPDSPNSNSGSRNEDLGS